MFTVKWVTVIVISHKYNQTNTLHLRQQLKILALMLVNFILPFIQEIQTNGFYIAKNIINTL